MLSRRRQLRYLVTIAEEGNLTAAAKRLKVAQPTLSQALAQLESELGATLLERHAKGMRLTPAGVAYLLKARIAAAAEVDAIVTAQELARNARGGVTVGFVGPPPAIARPELFAALAAEHPDAPVFFRELSFPRGTTVSWLAGVDVSIGHAPAAEEGVGIQCLRVEPRTLVVRRDHPLAERPELSPDDVLEECFVSYHPEVQREWVAFHSLDDCRGGPPRECTPEVALTPLEMLGIVSTTAAVTTAPLADARVAAQTRAGVVGIPLADVDPIAISLAWRQDNSNPLIGALVAAARNLGQGDGA